MAVQIGGTLTARPKGLPKSDETFSSRLVNYIDGVTVGGVPKTKFYTEVNTNLKVGDKVFIINGNYCNSKLNEEYIYNEYSTGYTILEIDRCAITLDAPLTNILPKNTADFNDETSYIKTFVVNNNREVDYYDYSMTNQQGESSINPKFEISSTIKDMIYNNSGVTITSPNGVISPNTFYSYVLQSGVWNKYPLNPSIINNELQTKKLYLMEPFIFNWFTQIINCEKNKVYYLDTNDNKIKLDITYEDTFLSKSNFRFGNFKGGSWNDGVFGKKTDEVNDRKTYWEGAKWKSGIFYNSDWLNGIMESKSDKIKQQSYYGELGEDGLIKQSTDFNNNKTFGYNYIFESNIENATIQNGNIFRGTFGSASNTNSIRDEYYQSTSNSFNISINNGLYYDCDFNYIDIKSGVFEHSDITNSSVNGARILDTHVEKSIVTNTEYDSVGSIKVIDYDKQYYRIDDAGVKRIAIVHKFYMNDADFIKIEEGDSVYFNNFISNHRDVDTLFDKEYHIGLGPNANMNGFNHGYLDNTHEVMVELKPKAKNEYKYILDSGTTSFNVLTASNDKFYNSLDLTFIVAPIEPTINSTYSVTVLDNDYDNIYNNIIQENEDYKSKIVDYKRGRIQVSKIEKSLLTGSTWKRGSKEVSEDMVIKPNDTSLSTLHYPTISITGSYGSYSLSVELDYSDNRDLWRDEELDLGEIVYLNNITYDEATYSYDLSGVYNVSTYSYGTSSRTIQLQDYGNQLALNIGVTFSLTGTYSYRNTAFKSGAVNDLKIDETDIKSGSFKRAFFNNTKLENDVLDTTDTLLLKANINKLRLFRSLLSKEDNLTLNKSFISESILSGSTVSDSLVYNSVGYDMVWNGGMFYGSEWKNGTFNNGIFNAQTVNGNNTFIRKSLTKVDDWYSLYTGGTSGNAMWVDGTFNNGKQLKSYWNDGIFNNGEFYSSVFIDGVWNEGEFGKPTLKNTDTQFLKGDWYNGVFIKGIFGNKESMISPATCSWYNGDFRGGEFFGATLSTTGEPAGNTVWYDGTFNGGRFGGSSVWKDGIFNDGKFSSFYGGGTGSSASNYSWENGLFNGGEFGDIEVSSTTTWNSTWYDGIFEGGNFRGKVWNNGIFTGGEFLGMPTNGASSSNRFYGESTSAVSYPENFVLSFSTNVSINNWYGLWRDGIVIDNLEDLTNKSDRRYEAIRVFKKETKPTIIFENALWINGTFSSTSAQMRNSVWLNGKFNRGEFIESSFNPYVPRWDFQLDGGASQSFNNDGRYQHSFTNSCVWNNGVFDNSDFHISSWNNGKFLYGTMSNAEFNNGVSNYMNAYNVIWNDGRWRNGNWYGANNNVLDSMVLNGTIDGPPGSVVWFGRNSANNDGMIHQMKRHNSSFGFLWNVFDTTGNYLTIPDSGQAANNEYYDMNQVGASLLTSTIGNFTIASNVEFNGYSATGYPTGNMYILADASGTSLNPMTASLSVDGLQVGTRYGNGAFKKGIWENGIWNNGARDVFWENTEDVKYFDSVNHYQLSRDVWQIVLTGSDQNSDIGSFTVGDDVSVGNIVLVDINGNRKLIKDEFKVVNIDENMNYLYMNTVIDFPIRKIAIDSQFHKIGVTKNVWKSGLFLNGRFNGVWNNGYFKGYPCITEMIDTQWIEGVFDGGHFKATTATYSDSITGALSSATYSTGLMQNADIDTNIEDPSQGAVLSAATNRFDTYIDVNFDNSYLEDTQLQRTTSLNYDDVDIFGDNPYVFGENITYDILSSVTKTIFKPSIYYKLDLGVKFTEYENVLTEDISSFSDIKSPDRLENNGWSFVEDDGGAFKLPGASLPANQTVFLASDNDFTEPVANGDSGYPLNVMNFEAQGADKYYIYHDNRTEIKKYRYSRIDIDILPIYSITNPTDGYLIPYPSVGGIAGPVYTELAFQKQDRFKISSFYFNRFVDDPLFIAGGNSPDFGLRLDNARYIELDMVPFVDFTGGDDTYINCDPRVPYQATAPFIDYDDTDFSFIDNVSFEFSADTVIDTPTTSPPVFDAGVVVAQGNASGGG